MTPQSHLRPKSTLAALLAVSLSASLGHAAPVVADGNGEPKQIDISAQSVSERILAINGGLIEGTGASVSAGSHIDPLALAQSANSRITLSGGSLTNALTSSGADAYAIAVQALSGGAVTLSNLTVTAQAAGADTGNRVIGLSARDNGSSISGSNLIINVSGDSRQAYDGYGAGAVYSGASITLNNNSSILANGAYTYGFFAGVGAAINSTGTTITTHGQRGVGVYANAAAGGGAIITLDGDSITTSGGDAVGLLALRQSSASAVAGGHLAAINADGVTVSTAGAKAHGVYADRGGLIDINNSTVSTSGNEAHGLFSNAVNYHGDTGPTVAAPAALTATDVIVTTTGSKAEGVRSEFGADVTLTRVSVSTSGSQAHGLVASNTVQLEGHSTTSLDPNVIEGTQSVLRGTDVSVTTTAADASAVLAELGAKIELTDATIRGASTTLPNGVLYARSGGHITLNGGSVENTSTGYGNAVNAEGAGSRVELDNVLVSTAGIGTGNTTLAAGLYASRGGTVVADGGTVTTTGARAIGLRAAHTGSTVTTSGTTVTTSGDNAHAVHGFSDTSGTERDISVNVNGGEISTSGVNAYGLYSQNTGSTVNSSADVSTTGAAGFGAFALGGGVINLTGGTIATEADQRVSGGNTIGTYGLIAAGEGSVINAPGTSQSGSSAITVTTSGAGAHAVRADTRGEINLHGASVSTSGAGAHGLQAVDLFSLLYAEHTTVSTSAESASALHASNEGSVSVRHSTASGVTKGSNTGVAQATTGASLNIENSTVTKTGSGYGNALFVSGTDTMAGVYNSTLRNESNGAGTASLSAGAYAIDGGRIGLVDSTVTTTGTRAYGVRTAGDGSRIIVRDSLIQTEGNNSHAVQAYTDPAKTQSNTIILTDGEVKTSGNDAWGLYAQNTGATIDSSADITTTGTNGFGAFALDGGQIVLSGGTINTSGNPAADSLVGSYGVIADGSGSRINATGNVGTESAGITVNTSGKYAAAAFANNGGYVGVKDGSLNTSGEQAYGAHAVNAGSVVSLVNTAITTTGALSSALRADNGGEVRVQGGRINAAYIGAEVGNEGNSNGTVQISGTQLYAQNSALHATFGSNSNDTATFIIDQGANVSSFNNVLLSVTRTDSPASDSAHTVSLRIGDANGSATVARGDIYDAVANKGANDRLDIDIRQNASLYSDTISGYNTLNVDGHLYNNSGSHALSILGGQSVSGTGTIHKDVVLNGGTLSTDVRIRGSLDLGADSRDNVEIDDGQSYTVGGGRQAEIASVSNAEIDATQGAAQIGSFGGSSRLTTGNWGASVGTATGGTIDASQGTAKVDTFGGSAELHTGEGGATIGSFEGGSIHGSGAQSEVIAAEVSSGAVNNAKLVVSNDGGSSGKPAGSVALNQATIGGNGSVNASLALTASTFAAGSSVGSLHVVENLSFDSESVFEWEINDATGSAGVYAGGWDFTSTGGILSFAGGATFRILSLNLENVVGQTANFDDLSNYRWLVAIAENGISGWEDLQIDLSGFLNAYTGQFALEMTQNGSGQYELSVLYTAVPEPATVALALGGIALLGTALARRRRHACRCR